MRILRKNPGFTAVATISLALAIGANTTIFSLAKQLLYERLAVPNATELRLLSWTGDKQVAVHEMWGDWENENGGLSKCTSFSYPVYRQLAVKGGLLQGLFAFKDDHMNATVAGEAQPVNAEMVSGNFYSVLGIRPQLGREIQPSDDAVPGAGTVVVISDGLWERGFGRSPDVLGKIITANQQQLTIVGVNPRGFTGAKSVQGSPDLFLPLSMQPVIDPKGEKSLLENPDLWWLNVMVREQPGIQDSEVQAALEVRLQAAVRGTMTVTAKDSMPRLELTDGSRGMHETDRMFKKPVYVLLTLTGFVLVLACANIANLMLARGTQRHREMSVRLALGAGRARILRQMLTESLMLAVLGGLGGLLLGYMGRNTIPKLLTNAWERTEINVSIDWGVFAFAAGITILTGIVFGIAPAWGAARAEVSVGLKEAGQTATRRRKGIGGKSIVGFQVALSTLLVVGALLFLRTLVALNTVNVGFRTDHLLLFSINPPELRYSDGKDIELHRRLEQGFAGLQGVEAVTAADPPFIAGNMSGSGFIIEGETDERNKDQVQDMAEVGNDFLKTLGIPLLEGRAFGPQDTKTSTKVAIINRSLARARFANTNPIGKRFSVGDPAKAGWTQIVGICGDTRYSALRDEPPPQYYLPYIQQAGAGGLTYEIRTRSDPSSMVPALRKVVQSIDPDLPMNEIRTQQEQIDANMQMERTFAALTAGFGVLALLLACVGIYGVMAYSVANRTNEIGIRLALGALPGQVLGMVLREATWISLAGVGVGLAAALGLARLVKSMLYGLQPNDPVSLISGAVLLLAVGLAASWIPARRAAGVEPMVALRHE
jgi:predicted permease